MISSLFLLVVEIPEIPSVSFRLHCAAFKSAVSSRLIPLHVDWSLTVNSGGHPSISCIAPRQFGRRGLSPGRRLAFELPSSAQSRGRHPAR